MKFRCRVYNLDKAREREELMINQLAVSVWTYLIIYVDSFGAAILSPWSAQHKDGQTFLEFYVTGVTAAAGWYAQD